MNEKQRKDLHTLYRIMTEWVVDETANRRANERMREITRVRKERDRVEREQNEAPVFPETL